MRILITAAEQEEMDCAVFALRKCKGVSDTHTTDFMLTGIGAASTAYRVTRLIYMAKQEGRPYDMALNIGIAGSYDIEMFPLGSIGAIETEYFGDLGFETYTGFQTLFDRKILESETFPYRGGALMQSLTMEHSQTAEIKSVSECIGRILETTPKATGVTIQTVSGEPKKVERMRSMFTPQIESMEGAAFYYVCILEHLPAIELRSISNEVGERNRDKWDIPRALGILESKMEQIFRDLALLRSNGINKNR